MRFINLPHFFNHKGLLSTVVLCGWSLLGCHSSTSSLNPQETPGTPLPDPMTFFQTSAHSSPPDSLNLQEHTQLQAGDVLLRRGYGLISDYIIATLQEPCAISHCGLLVYQEGKWSVLHTASSASHNGILVEPLTTYIHQSQAHSLVACRPNCTPQQRQQLLALAAIYQQKKIPFDYSFDDQNGDALYCTELLRNLFLKAFKQDYLPLHYQRGGLSLLGFQNFFDSSKFTILFNHCQIINTSK